MKKILITSVIFLMNVQIIFAQWSVDSLAQNRYGMLSALVGSKAVFTNGSVYDIYNFATAQWSSGNLLLQCANEQIAAAGDKVYIAGGRIGPYTDPVAVNYVNVYNSTSNTWTKLPKLSQARSVGAAASIGNKVIFAGGIVVLNYSKRVDIYNVNTGVLTISNLSQSRHNISVAKAGNKVVFAGGECGQIGSPVSSNKVDIFDNSTGTWSTALLSTKRQNMGAAGVGSKILFAGGMINTATNSIVSNRVDIYDVNTGLWTIASLSEARYSPSVAVSGNKVYFAGGGKANGTLSNRIDIYNVSTNTWSFVTMSSPHMGMAVGQTPDRIYFAGGITTWGNTGTKRIDAFDLTTNTWYVDSISQPRLGIGAASYGNQCLFMGGNVFSSIPLYTIPSKRIDLWTDLPPRLELNNSVSINTFQVYPNPVNANSIYIHFATALLKTSEMYIYDLSGNLLLSKTLEQNTEMIEGLDVSGLQNGEYLIIVEAENSYPISGRFLIQK